MYMCNLLFDEALNARLKRCVESCGSIERLAVFKVPARFVARESLPRTVTGKIQKHRL